jgi:hypothetical protein
MVVQSNLFAKREDKIDEKYCKIISSLRKIESLEKAIMVYSNIMNLPFDKQCKWCDPLNREIALLNGMVQNESDKSKFKICVLDWDKIHKFKVLDNMATLHRYIHGKAVRATNLLENGETPLIIELIDEAFYNVMKSNTFYPKSKEEFNERIKRIERALICLNEIQRPLLSYFNIMKYSNRVMSEWTNLLDSEIKLLKGLLKSDKNRLSRLS